MFADAVVSCMDALKEYRDWLNGLEQVLASRDWPGQRPEILSRQSEDVNVCWCLYPSCLTVNFSFNE